MSTENTIFGRIQMQHFAVQNLIQWGDSLLVGHSGIDTQHRAIFELGAKLYDNWRIGGNIEELRPTVQTLEEHLKTHFVYEEKLLAEICYDGLELHTQEHRLMLNEMSLIKERFQAIKADKASPRGSILAPGWPVLHFFLGFAIGHVMNSDMYYCQALIARRKEVEGEA